METVIRRALVVGAGQVGTFAARALARAGVSVAAADHAPAPGYFARYGPGADAVLRPLDVCDDEEVRHALSEERPDAVVFAAGVSGEACARDPGQARAVNVEGARRVARYAAESGARRVVLVSTLAVYGTRPGGPAASEEVVPRPESEYGRVKLEAEEAVRDEGERRGLDVRIVRLAGVYGPLRLGCGSRSARTVEALLLAALRRRVVDVEAPAGHADEYLYVKDAGTALAATVTREIEPSARLINVGSGGRVDLAALCTAIERVVEGARFQLQGAAASEPGVPPLDLARARRVLEFQPRYGLEAGLRDYIREAGLAA